MTLGMAERQGDLLDDVTRFCDDVVPASSVYALLHRERDRLFPDEFFADLFSDRGRRSVPPSVVATVMVLQRLEGLSDREAVERYTFDARFRYAAGVGGYDSGGGGPVRSHRVGGHARPAGRVGGPEADLSGVQGGGRCGRAGRREAGAGLHAVV